MSITEVANVVESQQWPQHDIRDPLGVWGSRNSIVGDGGDDFVKTDFVVAADKKAAYVYACYSANASALAVVATIAFTSRIRLLTNWPNITLEAGVQGYGNNQGVDMITTTQSSQPQSSIRQPMIGPADRFILLYDPRSQGTSGITIVSLEINGNTLNDTYIFEVYGYYWDRSVLQAPGGPRHPGAS